MQYVTVLPINDEIAKHSKLVHFACKLYKIYDDDYVSNLWDLLWKCVWGYRKEEGVKFSTYFMKSAYWAAVNFRKNQVKTRTSPLHSNIPEKKSDSPPNIKFDLSVLNERERSIIEQRYYKGLSLREVAPTMGCTAQTILNIEKRAIKKLREQAIQYEEAA